MDDPLPIIEVTHTGKSKATASEYARVFHQTTSKHWKNSGEENRAFFQTVQDQMNQRLQDSKVVFFGEVCDALGLKGASRSKHGWTFGDKIEISVYSESNYSVNTMLVDFNAKKLDPNEKGDDEAKSESPTTLGTT